MASSYSINSDLCTDVWVAPGQTQAEIAKTKILAQNFDWNGTGLELARLHGLFQETNENLFPGQDDLAEGIQALDADAVVNLERLRERSPLVEDRGEATAKDMRAVLLQTDQTPPSTQEASGDLAVRRGDTHTGSQCVQPDKTKTEPRKNENDQTTPTRMGHAIKGVKEC